MYNTVGICLKSHVYNSDNCDVYFNYAEKVFPFQVTNQFLTQKLHLNCKLPQC